MNPINIERMKKQMLFFVLLMFTATSFALAQADTKVTSGVVAHNNGDYEKALKYLNQGLAAEGDLKAKNVPKAYYYKGKSLLGVMAVAAQAGDQEKLDKYANAPLDAYECFKQSIAKDDEKKKYTKLAKVEMSRLFNPMLQGGLLAMNAGGNDIALKFLDAAAEIGATALEKDYYVTYDLRAQTHMALKDTANAYKDFGQAIKLFDEDLPQQPDLLVAYLYYRKALIERYYKKDLDAALSGLDLGKQKLESEWARVEGMKAKLSEEQMTNYTKQYDDAKADLSSFELDILINAPDKYQEALNKFEKAISATPDDYIVHVAYASLLEKKDLDKAVEMYEKAIAIDANKQIAHFNLGAIYVNRAAELAKKANETNDNDEYEKFFNEMKDNFKLAMPHMEKAHELEPNDSNVLNALMTITLNLEMTEDYDAYKAKKDALGG